MENHQKGEPKEKRLKRGGIREFFNARNPDLWSLVGAAAVFMLITYLVHRYEWFFVAHLGGGSLFGILLYVFVTVISVLVPPVNGIVLLPVASAVYGVTTAAVLSILGWTLGSMLAFAAARLYGEHLVRHFPSMARSSHIERLISEKHLFWSIVFLKMTFPVDILSYALGFFTRIPSTLYFWATIIGVTPFAFVFASLGGLSLKTQLLVFAGLSLIFLPYLYFMRKRGGEKEEDVL